MTKVGIGMRSIKTGLAVFICLALYTVIPLTEPTLAVLVVVMAIQNNIVDSVTFSKNRLVGTLLGTILGIIYTQIASQNLIIIAIGVIILISLLNWLNQSKNIVIALILFVNIVTGVVTGNPIIYGLNRFANTLVGLSVGFLVNYFIKPPNQIENIKLNVIEAVYEIERVAKKLIFTDKAINLKILKDELEVIETNLSIYNQDKKYRMAVMDKIKYVEESMASYAKVYSHMLIVKDQRAPLDEGNIKEAEAFFDTHYVVQKDVNKDEAYGLIYNYHINEIIVMVRKIKSDLTTVSKGKAIKQSFIK